jgi:alpha-methylacyl-CoA racemase
MLLADLGADVVRIDRVDEASQPPPASALVHGRSRRSIALDLRRPDGAAVFLRLVDRADGVIEVFRPGVAERLGIGPAECLARRPGLVYVRVTGWGQDGPYAAAPGHDLNYVALTGALHAIGPPDRPPPPPLNLIGDYGGGGMLAVVGMLSGLLEAGRTGTGQVVDASMVDGAALLTTVFHGQRALGAWHDDRQSNILDGGAPFYAVYETSDARFVSVAAGEPPFYAALLERLGIDGEAFPQWDRARWPALRQRLEEAFGAETRDHWAELLGGDPNQCFAPVLSFAEAPAQAHHQARAAFVEVGGVVQPNAAPRFGRTPAAVGPAALPGQHTREVLRSLGLAPGDIDALERAGVTRQRPG